MTRRAPARLAAALLAGTLFTPVAAFAQQDQAAQESRNPESQGDEIVVTARRRDESLSRVPIAITAIGSEELVTRNVVTDSDLQRSVPGLTIRQTQGNNSLTYSLRGQSADIFSGSPSAVITYLNEVPQPVSGASSFFDLQSIQVLKGPQGTLFGRNTTGGAVLFTSAQPTNAFEGFVRGRYGNFDRFELEGAINIPIVDDRVLLRVAGNLTYSDGFITNAFNGDDLGRIDRESVRVSLTVRPWDGVENRTMVQYVNSQGTNTGASYTYSVYRCGETNNGFALSCSAGLLFGPTLDTITGPGSWAAYLAAHPNAYAPGLIAYVDEQRRLGPYVTNHPSGARHFSESTFLTNITEVQLSSTVRLRNIFGYVDSFTNSQQPQLGAPYITILTQNLATGQIGNTDDLTSYSNELQLQGSLADGALDFIVGVYYQDQQTDTTYPQTYFELAPIIPFTPATNRFRIGNETLAGYAQATYDFTNAGLDGVSLTAGLRYTRERVTGLQLPGSDNFGPPAQTRDYEDPSWEVGLQWQATPSLMVYGKTRGSFRSGGYNGTLSPTFVAMIGATNLFESETTEDVEFGLKYAGQLMGRPAQLNIAVFNQWIHNVQRVEFPDPDGLGPIASIAITTNVPEEVVRGIEIEGFFNPAPWLRIGGQLALTDAEFTDNQVVLFGRTFAFGPVGDTPEASGRGYAQITVPIDPSAGEVMLYGEVYSQSSQYFSNAADSVSPRTELPGYTLVNGRLSWNNIMGSNISAAVYGENLTDEEYFVGGMQLSVALGHNAAVVGRPRTYGVEVSFRF